MAAKALVTGGAGFIGSALVRSLLEAGHQVRVLDNLSSGSRQNLKGLDVELIQADIRDADACRGAVEDVDWIFHLAAMVAVADSIRSPSVAFETNLQGSVNLLEAARQAACSRVVLSSSCAVYGNQTGPVAERAEPLPGSPYATSKAQMEAAGEMYARLYELSTISLRYFNVYGPRQSPSSDYAAVIPAFMARMLAGEAVTIDGDGEQTRDFIHVDEVARANLLAAEDHASVVGSFNIGSGESHSINDLHAILRDLIPQSQAPQFGPARAGDIRTSEADTRLAEQALGFRAAIDLQSGLRRTVEWFSSGH